MVATSPSSLQSTSAELTSTILAACRSAQSCSPAACGGYSIDVSIASIIADYARPLRCYMFCTSRRDIPELPPMLFMFARPTTVNSTYTRRPTVSRCWSGVRPVVRRCTRLYTHTSPAAALSPSAVLYRSPYQQVSRPVLALTEHAVAYSFVR